jgi:hypothetical protein
MRPEGNAIGPIVSQHGQKPTSLIRQTPADRPNTASETTGWYFGSVK